MSTSTPIFKLDCLANLNGSLRMRLLAAAQAAEATYEATQCWGDYADRAGAINCDSIEASDYLAGLDTRVCWAETECAFFVVYRGTPATSIPAWLRNLEALRCRWKPLKVASEHMVHAGFLAEYRATAGALRRAIVEVNSRLKPIYMIGHSKGGALAQYAALDATSRHVTLVTFGSPRCFNHSLSRISDLTSTAHFRVRHSNDLVPLMPGAGLFNHLRYRHAGELIMLAESGDIIRQPDWWARLKEAVCGYRLDAVSDHFIGGYVEALASHGID